MDVNVNADTDTDADASARANRQRSRECERSGERKCERECERGRRAFPAEGAATMGTSTKNNRPSDDRWIDVGAVGKPHGLRGEVVVHCFGDTPARFVVGAEVSLLLRGTRRTVVVAQTRPMPKKFVVRFEGCERIEDIEAWRGGRLQVRAGDLPPLEEDVNYHFELIGLEVISAGGERLGRLEEILATGGNDVYVVRGGGREYLIPAIRDAIDRVDLEAGEMILKDMEGLITP